MTLLHDPTAIDASSTPTHRPRRLRRTAALRRMVEEHRLSVDDLIAPLFVTESNAERTPIASMPGQYRWSVEGLVHEATALHNLGIPAIALFPAIPDVLKDPSASEGLNPDGLYPRAIRAVKAACPDLMV
ncbi:MAG: porphobilinogen synthase, partial [Bacteroidota bacterium]